MNRNLQEDEGMETTWEREGEGTWDRKRGEQPGWGDQQVMGILGVEVTMMDGARLEKVSSGTLF